MQIIDTHTHLYLKQFKEDVDKVIERAINKGIDRFIFPAIDSSYMSEMHDLENKYPQNIAGDIPRILAGISPEYCREYPQNIAGKLIIGILSK